MDEQELYNELTTYGSDDGRPSYGEVKVYDGRGYYVTTRLSDLPGAVLTEYDYEDGRPPQRGIFLPFKEAGLFVSPKKNVMLTCKMEIAQIVSNHHTHLLTQVLDRQQAECRRQMGVRQGFIGFARPFDTKKRKK